MELEALIVPLELSKKTFDLGIAGAMAGIAALGGVVAGMIKLTFDWAEKLDSLGDVIGGTKDEVAALAFVAQKSGVGVDTFTQANKKLEGSLLNAWGGLDKTGKKLYEYGIYVKDANGKTKTQAQLTSEIAKKYQSLGTQQERVNFLTQVYGKEGAKLVDFFDTLNGEGGISAVEDKVRRLGLAIDPSRYEQFNRNLEELKLIGTGIAVTFTESVMPALEGALDWTTKFASAPIEQKFNMLLDPLKKLFNFSDWFRSAVHDVDWGGLSDQLAAKISSIDWSKSGLYIRQGFLNLFQGIETIVTQVDWKALADSTGDMIKGLVAGLSGYPDWNSFAEAINNGINHAFDYARNYSMSDFERDWTAFVQSLANIWQKFMEWAHNQATLTPGRNVQGGSNSSSSTPPYSNGSGSNVPNRRASGGAVIGGQSYMVGEFKAEQFTPNQSGRVDNPKPATVDYDRLGQSTAKHILRGLKPMLELAKA